MKPSARTRLLKRQLAAAWRKFKNDPSKPLAARMRQLSIQVSYHERLDKKRAAKRAKEQKDVT